jgi:predicted anti-sigma-YlaC factor YlaD
VSADLRREAGTHGSTTFVTHGPLVTMTGALSITSLVMAEGHAKAALRLLQLDPDHDLQIDVRILDRLAARLRARRWAA